jgi:hypothetical protein
MVFNSVTGSIKGLTSLLYGFWRQLERKQHASPNISAIVTQIDPSLVPYITKNDPLPSTLRSIREVCLQEAEACAAACDALIGELEAKLVEGKGKIDVEELQEELLRAREANKPPFRHSLDPHLTFATYRPRSSL